MELPKNFAELQPRMISAIVLVLMALFALWAGGMFFIILIMLAALQMIREWDNITLNENIIWRLCGLAYVALPCAGIVWLHEQDGGAYLVLTLFLTVWASDIGAYFSGRLIGGPKLAPAISPNKTWSGAVGGAVLAAIVMAICTSFSPYPTQIVTGLLLGFFMSILAQAGDLFESWLKRRAGVKDSSNIIPGHGGLLDRVDGMVPTTPFFAFIVLLA